MMDLGKKMGDKLEEKRRQAKKKGRHIIEKMCENARANSMERTTGKNDGATDSEVASDISCEEGKPVADPAASSGARRETTTLHEGKQQLCWIFTLDVVPCQLARKWAVDMNEYACESLKHNHPSTQAPNANI
ncbi:DNA (cytosine-5)-methyltransferase 1 [Hordeum vulgare]|nr:DNA (cytosine-5)-methyltransferase 1 [Hordeum vulgare]